MHSKSWTNMAIFSFTVLSFLTGHDDFMRSRTIAYIEQYSYRIVLA